MSKKILHNRLSNSDFKGSNDEINNIKNEDNEKSNIPSATFINYLENSNGYSNQVFTFRYPSKPSFSSQTVVKSYMEDDCKKLCDIKPKDNTLNNRKRKQTDIGKNYSTLAQEKYETYNAPKLSYEKETEAYTNYCKRNLLKSHTTISKFKQESIVPMDNKNTQTKITINKTKFGNSKQITTCIIYFYNRLKENSKSRAEESRK